MTPAFQAAMDWRDEGAFHPEQYPQGSAEQMAYIEAQQAIEKREAQSDEHYNDDSRQERDRQDSILAQLRAG